MSPPQKKSRGKVSVGDVGYGKPPAKHRFKPGQSGNPRGRPKSLPQLHELFAKELRRSKVFIVDGKQIKMTMLEVLVRKLIAAAGNGNSKPLGMTLEMMNKIEAKQRQDDMIARGGTIHKGMTDKEAAAEYERWVSEICGKDSWICGK